METNHPNLPETEGSQNSLNSDFKVHNISPFRLSDHFDKDQQ